MFPKTEVAPTDYGFMIAHRHDEGDRTQWNVKHWLMPFYKLVSQIKAGAPVGGHAWVPMDDENCLAYSFEWHPDRPLSEGELEFCRREHMGTSDIAIITVRNHLLQVLRDHKKEATPPSLDPVTYRVRSARFTSASGLSLREAVDTMVPPQP